MPGNGPSSWLGVHPWVWWCAKVQSLTYEHQTLIRKEVDWFAPRSPANSTQVPIKTTPYEALVNLMGTSAPGDVVGLLRDAEVLLRAGQHFNGVVQKEPHGGLPNKWELAPGWDRERVSNLIRGSLVEVRLAQALAKPAFRDVLRHNLGLK